MPVAIVTTNADSRRVAATYRLEFATEQELKEWLDTKYFLEERNRIWMEDDDKKRDGLNTIVNIFHDDGTQEIKEIRARWDQVVMLFEIADELARPWMHPGSGRPPKRVLAATTSKERRLHKRSLY